MAVVKNKIKKTSPTPSNPKTSIAGKKTSTAGYSELEKLVAECEKKFGKNALRLGFPKDEKGNIKSIERVSTGSITLDLALGGGLPLGRYHEISGGFSSTKTTQAMHIVRNAQEMGLVCALLDIENTTDETYLRALGVNPDTLLYSNPDGSEEAMQMIHDMQKSGLVHVAVLDSIASMSPNKEQETNMQDSTRMGIPQSLMGEFLRKYQANNNRLEREGKRPFTVIAINQLREKIGAYGDPEYTPGGRAKEFFSTVVLRLRRGDWIAEGKGEDKEIIGQVVKFQISKNKTFKRMVTGEFDFYFAENSAGVPEFYNDTAKEIVMLGVEWGIIERAGAWFKYRDSKYQGLEALLNALKYDEAMVSGIRKELMNLVKDVRK
jgi:recombination protein RecA